MVKILYLLSGLLLALTVALILEGAFTLALFFAWLIGVNAITFLFYGVDKLNSKSTAGQAARIPESTLLILTLAGGTPLALLAMAVFTHKVSDIWFLLKFFAVVALQAAFLVYFWDQIPWPAGMPLG